MSPVFLPIEVALDGRGLHELARVEARSTGARSESVVEPAACNRFLLSSCGRHPQVIFVVDGVYLIYLLNLDSFLLRIQMGGLSLMIAVVILCGLPTSLGCVCHVLVGLTLAQGDR